jgi:colanic acid biosynthesis glycosyl transferase WcaI
LNVEIFRATGSPRLSLLELVEPVSMTQIIFLNRYFYPDRSATSQVLSDLAFALAERGYRVRVITSRQRYDAPEERLSANETFGGVEIERAWTSRFGRQNLVGRAVDYLTFYVSAAWALACLARRHDVIVSKTDPPMLSVVVGPIAHWRHAKLVNWLQDIYPEIAEVLGVGGGSLSRFSYGLMRTLRNRSLKRAAMNVVVGERMAERIAEFGVPPNHICVIPNWADGKLIEPRDRLSNNCRGAWGLAGKFVVGYSGNLGRAHVYHTLLDAISFVEAHPHFSMQPGASPTVGPVKAQSDRLPEIVWLFIGGGALYEALRKEILKRQLHSVMFKPYQPREMLGESLSAADVHLVSLRSQLEGLVVPSKFYGVAAAGRPAIFVGDKDGEIARLVTRHECGITIEEGDGSGLAQIILSLAENSERCRNMGERARRACEFEFSKTVAIDRWERLLNEVSTST